ncbi:hypothetical protein AVEN_21584-1 [Araneus ventricosus]|uniref:Uncharacterized protein n=1 Tax=Araneus ventricosus TaxID=182803 RepID=A0A4Y2MGX2_ARAVE|nr:hypothetical protein AVEN_243306-1 [Araneus ventricosus]GBN25714.1 hypothetical protein AVEN_21584-1 [Araneus ventricosus]
MVGSQLQGLGLPGWKPDSTEDLPCVWTCCTLNCSKRVVKCPPIGVMQKFEVGCPARVSASPSDSSSKLQGLSQNSPRVASE